MKKLVTLAMLLICSASQAASYTLPEYSLPTGSAPFPPLTTVGIFEFDASEYIAAELSGTFGNSDSPSSAAVDVFLDGILVGACAENEPCFLGGPHIPWSYEFSSGELNIFEDGEAVLQVLPHSISWVRLSETTLTLTAVPIPAAAWLFGSALAGLGWLRRRGQA